MGVYIKGMPMPSSCGSCWFCRAVSNEKWHCRLTGKSFASYSVGWGNENNTGENGQHPYIRRDDCPLIPVPPHGRLIDADELIKSLSLDEDDAENGASLLMAIFLEVLKAAPTIIEAEEGE